MRPVSAEDVRYFVLSQFDEALRERGLTPESAPDDFDLLTEGIIDSLGIIEIISAVDAEFGLQIDYEDLDPKDLTVIGPFSRYVAEKAAAGAPASSQQEITCVE